MLRNDGYILYEDPDIIARGPVPPNETMVIPLSDPEVDGTLYDWVVNIRSEDSKSFVAADPGMFDIVVTTDEVRVTLAIHDGFRPYTEVCRDIRVHGHLIGDHTLLKAEVSGLTQTIIYDRAAGDTTDFTTLDWILYNWRINGLTDVREYVRISDSDYGIVVIPNRVTITLNSSTTSWISTRLLGYTPSTTGGDNKVKVTSNDTTADYLLPKLQAGANITLTEINDGGNEKVEIAATGVGDTRYRERLIGTKNGVNTVFTTSQKFTRTTGKEEWVYYNGVFQEFGAGNDYTASESGGVGTGFDTITMSVAPYSWEKLEIVYIPV
jgi:hypothetical protein